MRTRATLSGIVYCTAASLAVCLPVSNTFAAVIDESKPFITTGSSPPPGFEDLVGPQLTQVDVYFGGRLQATTMAIYGNGTIEFLHPAEVVAAIPQLIDPAEVTTALTGPLANNADKLCRYAGQADCGTLQPEIAGVIFDESRFRLDLFVAHYLLQTQPVHRSKFLPDSTADFSTVHMVSMSVSGGGGLRTNGFNFGSTSLFARRADRIRTRYDFSDDGFSITELSWQRDSPGWQYEAGSFRSYSRSISFLGDKDVIGFRAGGSLDTRADLDTAEATPIFLFLNQRSRVDIYRAGQLLDSRFYDAGNQQLDTARLPDGAYDIQVQSRDVNDQELVQTFFFVRTARLPPIDQPLYYIEAGKLAQVGDSALPVIDDHNWLRIGTARRFKANFGAETELVHNGGTMLMQGGLFLFGPGWQLEAGLLGSSRADHGASIRGTYRKGETAVGFDYRRIVSGAAVLSPGMFNPVPDSYAQGTFTLSLPLFTGRLYTRAQVDQRGNGNNTSLGVLYARSLLRRSAFSLDLDIDATRHAAESVLRIGVKGRWRRDQLSATARPHIAMRFGDNENSTSLLFDASATRDDRETALGDVSSSVFTASDIDSQTTGAGITSESSFGYSNVEIQHTNNAGSSGFGYSANARFSVVSDDGHLAWGGRRSDLSAVVLDFGGDADTDFSVLVDQRSAGIAQPDKRNVIGLRPYQTYEIRVEPHGDAFVDFDQSGRLVTLYPGNVETLHFEANAVTVVVGQIINQDGAPIANARFDGISGFAGTDDSGWFQIEIADREPLLLRQAGQKKCRVELPVFSAERGLAVLEPLICQPIPD